MEELNDLRLDWDVVRINSVYQIEMLSLKDMGGYVYESLLPNLQKSYKHSKNYLTSTPRKNIYCIKKCLADLVENHKFVKISTSEDIGSEYLTRQEALFLAMESLNLIYSFCVIMKSKLYDSGHYSKTAESLNTIMKLIGPVQKDIQNSMEADPPSDLMDS